MNIKLAILLILIFPLVVGCGSKLKNGNNTTSTGQTAAIKATHVIIVMTEYYTSSPAQGRPADGSLEVGTEVRLINDAGSYLLVETITGIRAYVSSSALKPIGE